MLVEKGWYGKHIQVRQDLSSSLHGQGFWLSKYFAWSLQKDNRGTTVLVPERLIQNTEPLTSEEKAQSLIDPEQDIEADVIKYFTKYGDHSPLVKELIPKE